MLTKKMFRDIKKNISQFITIFLMLVIGVMAYSGIKAYMDGMSETANKFYTENNLQDLNVIGSNFTIDDLNEIKNIDNVIDAERKLVIDGTTDNDKILKMSFIESNNISKFYVIDGVSFDYDKSGVWLDNFYASENNIKVGDYILVKYGKFELKEKVLGLINVPDHIYDVRDDSELFPNRKEFGFAYLSSKELPKEYLIFNNIMVKVNDKDNVSSVKEKIDSSVDSTLMVINIEDTSSYSTYQGEIDEGKTYVGVFSGLFLFIAMLCTITTMKRIVENQRIQIGTLKALGFSDKRITLHYISYGFWISLASSIIGLILGYYFIGNVFISLEMSFFEVPNGKPLMNSSSYIVALLSIVVTMLITYFTAKNILKENPAETLRNKIPSVKSRSINATNKGIFKKLSFSTKWNIRDMIRNKARTIMGIAGISSSCILIVCALGMLDSMNYFIDLQFEKLYNFDYKLNLNNNISDSDLLDLENKYGYKSSKSYAIEIDNNGKIESNNLFISDASGYVRFVDNKDNFIDIDNDDGVYVTYKLASNNGYKIGDIIKFRIYGSDKFYESKIVGYNKDPQNQNVTASKKYLESLNIKYVPDSIYTNYDLSDKSDISNVTTIQNIDSLKDGMSNMLSMMKTMLTLIIGIAVILGAVIIYNLNVLSFFEKQYQFATLKVLGFENNKIKKIFIKQNSFISIISIILGLPLGYCLTEWLFKMAIDEHYDFSAHITIRTYIIAIFATYIISYVVSNIIAKKIKDIDMVTSLKGNE